jgi:aspartyl-tRNA(Asn)/glutamyl-tRNA(Gln) amidotransferase subunit C
LSIAKAASRRCFGDSIRTPMSADSEINIDYVANLARLALTPEEKIRYARQLGDILHYVEKLKAVDVTGVEPTAHASPVFNVWREDIPQPGLTVEQALRNAPAQRQQMIVVPKVVE